jgi:hypothetical protein
MSEAKIVSEFVAFTETAATNKQAPSLLLIFEGSCPRFTLKFLEYAEMSSFGRRHDSEVV